ncbi:MAG TPA: hypothetical protein VN371_06655 [Chlorobaculum sp.]|nr:hypothetical protein [Chlorobaculum sp.]
MDSVFVDRLRRRLKHVDLYLDGNSSGTGLHQGLRGYFQFYDAERLLQSFSSQIPDGAYASEVGGGAAIVEEFVEFGQRHSAF